jgi:AcrR family transcriptional regulator
MAYKSKEISPRDRIIKTALDLFYSQGYLATGINQIIAESGVSKNTFYYHFPSKEDLCVVYLRERHSIWSGWLKDKINKFDSPYDRFMAPMDFLEKWMQGCDYRGCAFLNIASEVPNLNTNIRREVIYSKNSLKALLLELTKELKRSDAKYKEIDEEFVSNSYYVIFEGAIVASQNYGEIWPVEAARKNIKKIVNP